MVGSVTDPHHCWGSASLLGIRITVADPHHLSDPASHFDAYPDADSDHACHFDADPDPDPTFHFNTDPDPSFQIKAPTP